MEASDYSTSTGATTAESNGSSSAQSPWDAHLAAGTAAHPEITVIGAFVGGFVFAKLLKALGGGE
jgi:hypothetical protein